MLNEIIAIYAITDDLLKAIGHDDDIRREMSDAEILTTALVAAMFFNGKRACGLCLHERPQLGSEDVGTLTI